MGMFDSLYDTQGNEWQTKAYGCTLEEWGVGDAMPHESGRGGPHSPTDDLPDAYQVRVLGGPGDSLIDSYATVRGHVLTAVPAGRDQSMPLVDYCGGPAMPTDADLCGTCGDSPTGLCPGCCWACTDTWCPEHLAEGREDGAVDEARARWEEGR